MKSTQVFLHKFKKIIKDVHASSDSISMLDFFRHGFRLTDDDRFKTFNLEFAPWVKALCEWFHDAAVDWIYLVQGSQTTKTTFLMGVLLYVSQYIMGAVPCFWVQSTEDEAKIFIDDRLKPFLDEAGLEKSKRNRWKQQAFRVFNAAVKVGYATTKSSLRSKPQRFIFGDECGIWKESIAYTKKRTRTFAGRRKGFFGTTPPETGDHHSWKEATSGNFYQWWVECSDCGKSQGLKFSQLKWTGKENGVWNYDKVKESARYQCEHCGSLWNEDQKLDIIQTGKVVCVDPDTKEPKSEKKSDSKTLQVSALYSIFTSWGQLACDFLTAKAAGYDAMVIFITDELAEVPSDELGESIKAHELSKYIVSRKSGMQDGYALYTGGVDVQRLGEVYWAVYGWQVGAVATGHLLDYGKTHWKEKGPANWEPLLKALSPYRGRLFMVPVDATDGIESQNIIDFCYWAGHPFIPLLDTGCTQFRKVDFKDIEVNVGGPGSKKQCTYYKIMSINSASIKNDIATAFSRAPGGPGAWTFPSDTDDELFKHFSNEHRVKKKQGGREVLAWAPKHNGAPQHWFSASVYATAAMEFFRYRGLQTTQAQEEKEQQRQTAPSSSARKRRRRVVSSRGPGW